MPFVDNHGVRIHYELEGHGNPVVLQYGQYFPLDIWYEHHYVRAMKDDCRLILVDARGHGDSDKPHDPAAYQMERMASDIVAVLDALHLEKAHYMGYSSGGALGFALAQYAPQRCSALILGGTYPYSSPDSGSWHTERIEALTKQTTEDFVVGLEDFLASQGFPPLSPRMRTAMLKHDTRALIRLAPGSPGPSRAVVRGCPGHDLCAVPALCRREQRGARPGAAGGAADWRRCFCRHPKRRAS